MKNKHKITKQEMSFSQYLNENKVKYDPIEMQAKIVELKLKVKYMFSWKHPLWNINITCKEYFNKDFVELLTEEQIDFYNIDKINLEDGTLIKFVRIFYTILVLLRKRTESLDDFIIDFFNVIDYIDLWLNLQLDNIVI